MEEIVEKEYKCIKGFELGKRDENEMEVEGESFVVPVDSTWEERDFASLSDIRIESDFAWIEIDEKKLESHLEQIYVRSTTRCGTYGTKCPYSANGTVF